MAAIDTIPWKNVPRYLVRMLQPVCGRAHMRQRLPAEGCPVRDYETRHRGILDPEGLHYEEEHKTDGAKAQWRKHTSRCPWILDSRLCKCDHDHQSARNDDKDPAARVNNACMGGQNGYSHPIHACYLGPEAVPWRAHVEEAHDEHQRDAANGQVEEEEPAPNARSREGSADGRPNGAAGSDQRAERRDHEATDCTLLVPRHCAAHR